MANVKNGKAGKAGSGKEKKKRKIHVKIEYLKITAETFAWFETLFPKAQKDMFLKDKNLFAIGAVVGGIACGKLILRNTPSFIQIVDIFVHERFRHHGIGKGMLRFLLKYAYKEHVPVLAYFPDDPEDGAMRRFFEKDRIFKLKESSGYYCRVSSKDISSKELLDLNKNHSSDFTVRKFSSLPLSSQKAFFEARNRAGDYMAREIQGKKRLRDLCLYTRNNEGKISAIVFVSQRHDGDAELDYLWVRKKNASSALFLLSEAIKRVMKTKKDFSIYIAAVSPVIQKIVDRLLPKREILKKYYRAIFDEEKVNAGIRASKKKAAK